MTQHTAFGGVVTFLEKLGVYEIVLPFLLVFTIIFAILEKTKVLGVEKVEGKEITKKNLNSMVAFVIAFLVVASARLVSIINEVMANIVLLLLLAISFLLLVGVFFKDKEFSLEDMNGWTKFFMFFMFIGVVLIFLNALGWLAFVLNLFENINADWAASLIFVGIIIGFIWFITKGESTTTGKKDKKEGNQ